MICCLKSNYNDFKVIEQNRLPSRAYFIPFPNRKLLENVNIEDYISKSTRVISLNGNWDFKFYEKPKLPNRIESSKINFTKISVPSCWQLHGYEKPFYLKERYQFNCKPPVVPEKNSVGIYSDGLSQKHIKAFDCYNTVGIYRKIVDIKTEDKTFILSFLGVSSCFDLYVNGNHAGYSQASFNTSEFDITSFLISGRNEILVVVRKWCVGSYLEAQDMFRLSGIFRDVLLFANNKSYIYDYNFLTSSINNSARYQFNLSVNVKNYQGNNLRVTLENQEGEVVYKKLVKLVTEETLISYQDIFQEYSSEKPYLYKLYLSLVNDGVVTECVCKNVAFKTIEISDGVFYLNRKNIKIKGLCYDEWHQENGYSLSYEDMIKDIQIIKQYNFNTIRFIKPPHPFLVDLCDIVGLYVIAEADIDTSGACYSPFYRPNLISKKKKWAEHYLDRTKRLYDTLKNQASVIIWSIGSSSGGIVCQDYCYDYLKKVSALPVMYDGAAINKKIAYDILAIKTLDIKELVNIPNKGYNGKNINKPILLTEYITVRGSNFGGLKEYSQAFDSQDCFMGGCVKSFCDKAIFNNKNKYQYSVGGDFSEFIHDFSACLNGLFSVDRKPYSSALSMKYLNRPISSKLIDVSTIEFKNNCYFQDTKDIKIILSVFVDGKERSRTHIETVIMPRHTRQYDVFLGHTEKDMFLNVKYLNKLSGHLIAEEQLSINEEMLVFNMPKGENINVKDAHDLITVNFHGGFLRIDKSKGCILNYNCNGVEYMETDPTRTGVNCFSTNILRPLTEKEKMLKQKQDDVTIAIKDFAYKIKQEEDNENRVEIMMSNVINIKQKEHYVSQDMYVVYASGRMEVYTTLHPRRKKLGQLKCLGKVIKMPLRFNEISYYGRGPTDNYPDTKEHSLIGRYDIKATNFANKYLTPQEAGNRCDTRYAMIKSANGQGLMFNALVKPFNLNIRMYPQWKIDTAKRIEDLGQPEGVYLHIDGEVRGVGNTNHNLPTNYQIPQKESYVMGFSVIPFQNMKI